MRAQRRGLALPPLLFVTDDEIVQDVAAIARNLPTGTGILLRHRDDALRASWGKSLLPVVRARKLKLFVADDFGLARLLRAGLHCSENAKPPRRQVFGVNITRAAHSERAMWKAKILGADAIVLAPVFVTQSHVGRAALGPLRARLMALRAQVPVYALGGINAMSARRLRGAGLAGIAAVSAFTG